VPTPEAEQTSWYGVDVTPDGGGSRWVDVAGSARAFGGAPEIDSPRR